MCLRWKRFAAFAIEDMEAAEAIWSDGATVHSPSGGSTGDLEDFLAWYARRRDSEGTGSCGRFRTSLAAKSTPLPSSGWHQTPDRAGGISTRSTKWTREAARYCLPACPELHAPAARRNRGAGTHCRDLVRLCVAMTLVKVGTSETRLRS